MGLWLRFRDLAGHSRYEMLIFSGRQRHTGMSSERELQIREKLTRCWLAAEPSVRAFVAAAIRSGADREDVLQQVALTVARRFEEFDESRPFVAWALWLAKSRIVDFYRSQDRQRIVLADGLLDRVSETLVQRHADVSPRREALERCLDGLPPKSRSLVEYRYHDGLRIEQIAAAIRTTPGSVRVALFRIRETLAACIERRLAGQATT
jgi:RNA polymerase sigma-70 factor (ECF subfamily)